eukprot:SAG11_NODE_1505_length_4782_cov_2.698270_1_plen_121_part_00
MLVETDSVCVCLHTQGQLLYVGYADDARNTDNSWLETKSMHYHCSPALAARLDFSGSEADGVQWLDVKSGQATLDQFPPRHRAFVIAAITQRRAVDLSFEAAVESLQLPLGGIMYSTIRP